MNKNLFSKELTKRLKCSNAEVMTFINEYHNLLTDLIQEGNNVKFQYFGVFTPHERSAKIGRNPKTGEKCHVDSKKTMKFKPSEFLINKINKK